MIHLQPPAETGPDDPAEARDVWRERILREMAELELEAMRALTRQVVVQAEGGDKIAEAGLALSRVTRSLRLTMALEARFAKLREARLGEITAEDAERAAEAASALGTVQLRGLIRKDQVMQVVEQVIESEAEGERAESLLVQLTEQLEEPRDEEDYADRPIGELAVRICNLLGLAPDWSEWADEDWAVEEAETRERSGSPFAPPGWRLSPPSEEAPASGPGEDGEDQPP